MPKVQVGSDNNVAAQLDDGEVIAPAVAKLIPSSGIVVDGFSIMLGNALVSYNDGDVVRVSPGEYHAFVRHNVPIAWDKKS